VIAALVHEGAQVAVANRSATRQSDAVALGNAVRANSTVAIGLHDAAQCATIINTTPQGMAGVAQDSTPLEAESLAAHHTVLDAVYHPLETVFLRQARARGARIVDGVSMLCAQAARQQELWLGRLPDVALMRRAALEELAKSQQ
jgi:shikimate dehydrogenase